MKLKKLAQSMIMYFESIEVSKEVVYPDKALDSLAIYPLFIHKANLAPELIKQPAQRAFDKILVI
ncbi:MAG: hypothetical protein V1747_09585 [Candidatus Omnitrophota bacterium]